MATKTISCRRPRKDAIKWVIGANSKWSLVRCSKGWKVAIRICIVALLHELHHHICDLQRCDTWPFRLTFWLRSKQQEVSSSWILFNGRAAQEEDHHLARCHISPIHRNGEEVHGRGPIYRSPCSFQPLLHLTGDHFKFAPMTHLVAPFLGLLHDIVLVAKNGAISHPTFVKGLEHLLSLNGNWLGGQSRALLLPGISLGVKVLLTWTRDIHSKDLTRRGKILKGLSPSQRAIMEAMLGLLVLDNGDTEVKDEPLDGQEEDVVPEVNDLSSGSNSLVVVPAQIAEDMRPVRPLVPQLGWDGTSIGALTLCCSQCRGHSHCHHSHCHSNSHCHIHSHFQQLMQSWRRCRRLVLCQPNAKPSPRSFQPKPKQRLRPKQRPKQGQSKG